MSFIINSYQFAAAGYLLDTYTGATGAWSLRQLKTGVTNCIRVRRTNDNAEQDIGFSSGVLDESSLTSFTGANDGHVVTWYDQSGNAYNLTQATAGNQPKIVSAGTVLLENSEPTIVFDGNDYLSVAASSLSFADIALFSVAKETSEISFAGFFGIHNGSGNDYDTTAGFTLNTGGGSDTAQFAASTSNDLLIVKTGSGASPFALRTFKKTSSTSELFENGTSAGTDNTFTTMSTSGGAAIVMGVRYLSGAINTAYALNGKTSETILFFSDQSSNLSAINSNIQTYYGL